MHSVIVHRTSLLRFKIGLRTAFPSKISQTQFLALVRRDMVEICVRSLLGWWVEVGRYEPGVGRADQ